MTVCLLHPHHYLMRAAGFKGVERQTTASWVDWFPFCIHSGDYDCDLCVEELPFTVFAVMNHETYGDHS